MPSYTILLNDSKTELEKLDQLRTVKDSFSWVAFLFSLPWLLWQRAWLYAAVYLAINLSFTALEEYYGFSPLFIGFSAFATSLYVGLEAGALRARVLSKRGYHIRAITAAETSEEAELRYFSATHHID